jgi:Ribbon-helix-helix protein, copG family
MQDLEPRRPILAFKCSSELVALTEAAAAAEGITKSDVVRRALMRDLARLLREEQAA